MGVRDRAPYLMLRLNKGQEAYDFLKWYQTAGQDGHYDWGDMTLSFLDVKDANCFESVSCLSTQFVDLSHFVALILLKFKMLLDLISLQESVESKELPANIPAEIFNNIRAHTVRSPIIKANKEIMGSKDQRDRINELVQQVKALYKAVDEANHHFWPALLNPIRIDTKPAYFTRGEASEMQHVLGFTYDAWTETAGATEVVRTMIKTPLC